MNGTFVHDSRIGRVVFGPGRRAELAPEIEALGWRRVLAVSTPGQAHLASELTAPLGPRLAGLCPLARMHVPVATVTDAVSQARELDVDGCVAIGGGSAIGLGKAIARETALPLLAMPTTYAGSEMTSIWGITEGGSKTTGRDASVLPVTVIYDAELTVSLPTMVSVSSAVNALAHAAESLYAPDTSPITVMMAGEAVRAIALALPRVVADPTDVQARSEVQYGAWLAGACLGATTMSLHHKLCHVLGGAFDLPHAATHAAVLPYVLAHNLPATPRAMQVMRTALGADDPATAVFDLVHDLGAGTSLSRLGLSHDAIELVVAQAVEKPYANPAPAGPAEVRCVLQAAYDGEPPRMSPHGRRPPKTSSAPD